MRQPLPAELAEKWGRLPHITYRGNGEWSASCPVCADAGHYGNDKPDRFRMFAAGHGKSARGWCRRCSFFEWADANSNIRPDPVKIKQQQELARQYAEAEARRIEAKIKALTDAAYWQGWHDAMSESQRQLWREQGIVDSLIDVYGLGYKPDHTYYHDGNKHHSPAMTIPHHEKGQVVNVQYRLTRPVNGAGKYRQTAGLPAAMFLTEPDSDITGHVLVVEGAKKAIVTYQETGGGYCNKQKMTIVGIPSKTPSSDMLNKLVDCEPIYICLDPDAYGKDSSARRMGEKLGAERVLFVRLPAKPDDLFTVYGLDSKAFSNYVRYATRTC